MMHGSKGVGGAVDGYITNLASTSGADPAVSSGFENVQSGDTLVIILVGSSIAALTSITGTGSAAKEYSGTVGSVDYAVYTATATGSETEISTDQSTHTSAHIAVDVFRGYSYADFGTGNSATASSTVDALDHAGLATDAILWLGAYWDTAVAATSAPSGFSDPGNGNYPAVASWSFYKDPTGGTSVNPGTFTVASATDWACNTIQLTRD